MADIRNALGEHAEALIADVLDAAEEAIIVSVMAKLRANEPIDAQFAIQKWLAIFEQRELRRRLVRRSQLEKSRATEDL